MRKQHWLAVCTLLLFLGMRFLKYPMAYGIFGVESWKAMDHDLKVALLNYSQIALILLFTSIWFRRAPWPYLGLHTGFVKGLLAGLLCTTPMWIGYTWLQGLPDIPTATLLHRDLMMAGFFEELAFRGFAFGLLYFRAGWGFIPAVLLPSVFFGIGHLYQAESTGQAAGIFLFTALANAGFAWFYLACRSLWMVVFLHGFMDLAWDMYGVAENVTGNTWANVFRFLTLGLAIAYCIREARANGSYDLRGKLWTNSIHP